MERGEKEIDQEVALYREVEKGGEGCAEYSIAEDRSIRPRDLLHNDQFPSPASIAQRGPPGTMNALWPRNVHLLHLESNMGSGM